MGKRYTVQEKRDLAKVMTNLIKDGMTNVQIADKLNEINAPMANGGTWKKTNVSVFKTLNRRYFAHAGMPVRRYKKRKTAIAKITTQNPRGVSVNTITAILTDPALKSGQVVKMLCAYLEV